MHSLRTFGARLLLILAAVTLVLAGCLAREEETPASSSSDRPAITGEPAGFDADDIAFAFGTITHHEQSVAMAALVPERSTDPNLAALASEINSAQGSDAELMKAFLVQWNENPNAEPAQSGAVPGMVDDATVARLQSSNGSEFDTLWLQSMIGHAQGAITLAENEVARGSNVDAVATAKQTVESQQAQIVRMQQLLG